MSLKKTTKVKKPTAVDAGDDKSKSKTKPEAAKPELKSVDTDAAEPEPESEPKAKVAGTETVDTDAAEPEAETTPTDGGAETSTELSAEPEKGVSTGPNRNAVGGASTGVFEEEAAKEGMDGLELGYGSFPNVKLDGGEFIDGDNNQYPSPMYFTPIASRAVLAFSQKGEDDGDVFFSYDGVTTTKGESVKEITDEWKEDGYTPSRDTRLEVDCLLQEETSEGSGEFIESEMVMFSLPPTARKKFSGKFAMSKRAYKLAGKGNADIIMSAHIGSKVKVGNKSFNPWTFGVVKPK